MIEGTSITGHYLPKPSSYRPMASMKVQSGGRDVKHRILRLALQVHAHAHVHVHVHVACVHEHVMWHVRACVYCSVYCTTSYFNYSCQFNYKRGVELIMTTTIRTLYESRAKSQLVGATHVTTAAAAGCA